MTKRVNYIAEADIKGFFDNVNNEWLMKFLQEEIAKQINKSVRTVKTYMSEMQKKGLIERKNSKKNGEWIVSE